MFAALLTRRNRSALLALVFCFSIGAWLFLGKELGSPSRPGSSSWDDAPNPAPLDTTPPHNTLNTLSTPTPCPICAPAPAPTCPEPPKPAAIAEPEQIEQTEQKEQKPADSETPQPRLRLSDVLFPPHAAPAPGESGAQLDEPWLAENAARLRALFRCLEDGVCKKNQASVVILESYFITGSYMDWTGGESIWGRSVIKALSDLGYTYLFAPTLSHALHLYHTLPTLTTAVLADPWSITVCASQPGAPDPANPLTQGFARTGHFPDGCARAPRSPGGIPLWKMLGFYFWPFAGHPLGGAWTLGPEPWGPRALGKGNRYVGYSVEAQCGAVPFVPHAQRDGADGAGGGGKAQAWVMAKRLGYFAPGRSAWANAVYDAASAAADVRFALGADQGGIENGGDGAEVREADLPRGMRNYGVLEQEAFMRQLAQSRVLIGIGNPLLSPSPYDALCLGVPFINPIHGWKHDEPLNKAHWDTQHDILAQLDPPYVYNVHQGDEKAFVKAIQDAIRTPIDRYILPRMHQDEITKRLDAILKTDWKGEAEKLLERRRSGIEKGDLFMI